MVHWFRIPLPPPVSSGNIWKALIIFDAPGSALTAARRSAQQRLSQPRWVVMLHDPGAALAAPHTAIDRMVLVSADIAYLAVANVNVDAAATSAHIAGRLGHAVGDDGRGVDAVVFQRGLRVRERPL